MEGERKRGKGIHYIYTCARKWNPGGMSKTIIRYIRKKFKRLHSPLQQTCAGGC